MSGQNGPAPILDEMHLRHPQASPAFPHAANAVPHSGSQIQPASGFSFLGFTFKSKDTDPCWRCKDCHKKCIPGTKLCHRCETSPGNSNIPCRRGPVCTTVGIPYLCPFPAPNPLSSHIPRLSPEATRAAHFLDHTRRRYRRACEAAYTESQDTRNSTSLFTRVATTKLKFDSIVDRFQEAGILEPEAGNDLDYSAPIIRIVWEMEDQPEHARWVGVESPEDLVGLLEAASLCEYEFGHHGKERKVVYNSMLCLSHAMAALRLCSQGLLAPDSHSGCADAHECISPGLRSLSKYAARYTEGLNKAIFHKDRRKSNDWLLIFYSLCIHSHVRRALMLLEQRLQDQLVGMWAASGVQLPGQPLASVGYLVDAVILFREISLQNRGNLAVKILNARTRPSIYLQHPQPQQRSHRLGLSSSSSSSSSSTASPPQSWEKWRQEGLVQYLDRIFDISPTPSYANPQVYQAQVQTTMYPGHQPSSPDVPDQGINNSDDVDVDSDAESDSNMTVVGMATAPLTEQAPVRQDFTSSSVPVYEPSHSVPMETNQCPPFLPSPDPSNWSMTSFNPDSTASSFLGSSEMTASAFSPTASYAGSLAPSVRDEMDLGIFDFDSNAFGLDGFNFYTAGQNNPN